MAYNLIKHLLFSFNKKVLETSFELSFERFSLEARLPAGVWENDLLKISARKKAPENSR